MTYLRKVHKQSPSVLTAKLSIYEVLFFVIISMIAINDVKAQTGADHEKIIQIRIYSITGACLATRLNSDDAQHMRLHVADLPPGIYQLQISGNEGMIGRERFIKQ